MMIIKTVSNILLLILILINISYGNYNRREDLQNQITVYRYEISNFNEVIKKNLIDINMLNQKLKELNDRIILLSSLFDKTGDTKGDTKEKLLSAEAEFIKYNDKIEKLKSDFKRKVLWLYKSGSDYTLEVLFSSKSFNDFYTRLEYMNKISQLRKNDFLRINQEEIVLEEKKKILNMNKNDFAKYLKEKKDDYRQLMEEKNKIEYSLNAKKDENENLQRQINRKENYISKLQYNINIFPDGYVYKTDSTINYNNRPFDSLKGLLILPVQSVDIIFDFGKSIDPVTRTILNNNGADVSISLGSEVKCVADGFVEEIRYIPFYGNTIIINHNNSYRTVYSVLKDINVIVKENIPAGKVIATTGENLNGQSFHFELWNDYTPLDPKPWFKRGILALQ